MNNPWELVSVALVGGVLSLFFYGGLYLTVAKGLQSPRPALWFLGSFVVRMTVVLTGFYLINDGHWQRLMACLFGFVLTGGAIRLWSKVSGIAIGDKRADAQTMPDASSPIKRPAASEMSRDAS
jgi:F1F0 ATPase subunit 2